MKREKLWKMGRKIWLAPLLLAMISLVACNPAKKYEEEERSIIQDYVAKNGITVSPDANGIYFIELTPGIGELIQEGDSVGVRYTGKFLNGKEFDSNIDADKPFILMVGSRFIIEGWSLALKKMRLEGKARVLLPSKVAYGSMGYSAYDQYGYYYTVIPGYTPLLFDMEVVELKRQSGK